MTERPACASVIAAARPLGPAPITAASYAMLVAKGAAFLCRGYGVAGPRTNWCVGPGHDRAHRGVVDRVLSVRPSHAQINADSLNPPALIRRLGVRRCYGPRV